MRTVGIGVCCLLLPLLGGAAAPGAVAAEAFAGLDLGEPAPEPIPPGEPPAAGAPACLAHEPSAAELVRCAWDWAGLEPGRDRSWRSRVRWSGWLPRLSGGVDYDIGDSWDYRYVPGEPRVDKLRQNDGWGWDADLKLDLSKAVYSSDELAVAREGLRRSAARRDLAVELIRLIYARRELLRRGLPPAGSSQRGELDELTAVIDAWTGSRFADRWCGRRS